MKYFSGILPVLLPAILPVILFCGIFLGCSEGKLAKYSELRGLRVLGLVASPPEVAAGGTATITPILSDLTEGVDLSFVAKACLDPGISYGSEPSCAGQSSEVSLASGTMNTGDMTPGRAFTGEGTSFAVTAPSSEVIFAQRSAREQWNGIAYLITYEVTNSLGDTVKAFKRLIISTRDLAQRNSNPVLSDVFADGAAFVSALAFGKTLTLTPNLGTPGAETYQVMQSDGSLSPRSEELVTTWISSHGTLKYSRTLSNESTFWETPASQPSGVDIYLLALTRDGRGGLAYRKKCFGSCP